MCVFVGINGVFDQPEIQWSRLLMVRMQPVKRWTILAKWQVNYLMAAN
jgi:hypothetical protein